MTTLDQFEDMLRRRRGMDAGQAQDALLRFDPQFRSPFDDLMGTGQDKPERPNDVRLLPTTPDGDAGFRLMGDQGGFGFDGPGRTSFAKVQVAADPDAKPAPFSPDDRTGARAPDPAMYDFRGRHDGGPGGAPMPPVPPPAAAEPEPGWWDRNIGINMGPFGPTAGPKGMLPGLRIPSYTMTGMGPVRSDTLPPTAQPPGWTERNLGVSISPNGVAFGDQPRVAPPEPPAAGPPAAEVPPPKPPAPAGSIPPPPEPTGPPPAAGGPAAAGPVGFSPVAPTVLPPGTPAPPTLSIEDIYRGGTGKLRSGVAWDNGSYVDAQFGPDGRRIPESQLPFEMRLNNAGERAYTREMGAASTNDVARSALGLPLIDQPRRQQAALEAQQMARQGLISVRQQDNQKEIATGRNKDAERADFQAKLIADGMSKGLNGPQLEQHVKSGMGVYDKFGGNQTPAPGTPGATPAAPGKPGQPRDPGLELSERARTALARKAVNGQQVPLSYQQVSGFLDTLGPNPQGLGSLVSEIAAGQHGDAQQLMDLIHNYAAANYVRGNPQGIPGMGVNGIWEGGDFVVPGLDGKTPLLSIEANRNAVDRSFNALFGGTAGNTVRTPDGRTATLAEALPGGLSVGLDKKMSTHIAGDRYRAAAALVEEYRRQMAAARGVR